MFLSAWRNSKNFFSKAKCCYDFNEQVTTKYKVVLYMPKTLYSVSKLGIHCNKIGNIQNYKCTNSTKKKGGKEIEKVSIKPKQQQHQR